MLGEILEPAGASVREHVTVGNDGHVVEWTERRERETFLRDRRGHHADVERATGDPLRDHR